MPQAEEPKQLQQEASRKWSRKTRITIMIDNDVLNSFRQRAQEAGRRYQTMINEALRKVVFPK